MSSPSPTITQSGQSLAGQYGFVDPMNSAGNLSSLLYGSGGALSGGALGTYDANANRIASQIAGLSGPLQESLSGLANYQANNALNAAASNFANQGALHSGAAAQAFGQALANPFAQAQAQLQGSQLQAGSSALGNLMNLSGNAYGNALGAATSLMGNTSGLVAPNTMTNPEYAAQQQGKQNLQGMLGGGVGQALGYAGGRYLAGGL